MPILRTATARRFDLTACVAGALLLAQLARAEPSSRSLDLVPSPKHVSYAPGEAHFRASWGLRVLGDSTVGMNELQQDASALLGARWKGDAGARGAGMIIVRPGTVPTTPKAWQQEEAYFLSVHMDSVVIVGPTAHSRFNGVQTLRQLLRSSHAGRLPCMTLFDYPSLRWRGYSDDISRGQMPTLTNLRSTLVRLGFYKVNLYCLYIEDAVRFTSAPEVGEDRGALTPSALRMISAEAARQHITLMPIFETLGHQERLLALERFAPLAEFPPAHPFAVRLGAVMWTCLPALADALGLPDPSSATRTPTAFNPTLLETRRRVSTLVDEVASGLDSPFFHLGGDEPHDVGLGRSKYAVGRNGFGPVYAAYMNALADHVRHSLGRQPVVYSDVILAHPDALDRLEKSVAIVDWQYDPADAGSSLQLLHSRGFQTVFASPGLWNWRAIYPDYSRAFPNITHMASACLRSNAAGLIVASWGDGGAESLRRANWLGIGYAADAAWDGGLAAPESSAFVHRFIAAEYGSQSSDLAKAISIVGWQTFPTLGSSQRVLHRRCALRTHTPEWLERMRSLESDMVSARTCIAASVQTVRFNSDGVEVLDYAASAFQYAADRELLSDSLARRMPVVSGGPSSDSERNLRLVPLRALRDSARTLPVRFAQMWMEDNRRPTLDALLNRLGRQAVELDALIGDTPVDGTRSLSGATVASTPGSRESRVAHSTSLH